MERDETVTSLLTNLIISIPLVLIFEVVRHIKPVYLSRSLRKFQKTSACHGFHYPSSYPFDWIVTTFKTSDENLLQLVGLDGYVLIRYIKICYRIGFFFSLSGVLVLCPVYGSYQGELRGWNKYTLANVPSQAAAQWLPVLFCYIYAAFFCQMLYDEYKNFVSKRVQYLMQGDLDIPIQTYYTVLVEKVPSDLQSVADLHGFFEKLFPGNIYAGVYAHFILSFSYTPSPSPLLIVNFLRF